MSEIKPKMVDGEAVCSRGCYRFNIDSDDDDDGVNSPEECGMVIGEGEPCFPYYRSQLAAERKRAEEARRLATLRGLGMLGLRDKLVSAESERDSLRATVERLESEAPAARTVTATVSAVLDEYGRDIVEVAKAV
ncbi:MAG: hypothetical protein GY851_26665, partial [bacterium]|nr:hypothetical protein [bacterium]